MATKGFLTSNCIMPTVVSKNAFGTLRKLAKTAMKDVLVTLKVLLRVATAGNVLNWSYTLIIERDGEPFSVQLDDWLYLVDEDNMINRTQVYKFGLPVGEITLYIGKK